MVDVSTNMPYNYPFKKGGDYMGGSWHEDKKTGNWFISIYWEKKRYRFFKNPETHEPFYSKKAAQKWLGVLQGEVTRGEFIPAAWKPNSPLSVGEYAKDWLVLQKLRIGDGKDSLSQNTYKDYRLSCKNHIVKFFGTKDIRRIRYSDLLAFQAWIPRADKGKYNVMSCLRTMLRFAFKNEDIVKLPPFPTLSYNEPTVTFLEFEDQNKIIEQIPEHHHPVFYFLQEYGCRPGEARALKKDCLDLEKGEFILRRAFAENDLREITKGKQQPKPKGLTPFMLDILKNMPENFSEFVFTDVNGKRYEKRVLNNLFHAARKKTDVPYIKMYNAFRHGLACQLLDMGYSLDHVQDQLDHTDARTTRKYARRKNARLTEALKKRRGVVVPLRKAND